MKMLLGIVILTVSGALMGQEAPALRDYRRQLDLMANQQVPAAVARPESLRKGEEALLSAPPADIKALLPSALSCLKSSLTVVQLNGVRAFFSVAMRMDSAGLMADYIADLGALLDGSDRQVWAGALFALGAMHPRPPAEVVRYLEPHLADEANTDIDFGKVSAALLAAAPGDDRIASEIIAVARNRGGHARGAAIGALMAGMSTSEEALTFVGEALISSDPGLRNAAVCALGGRPDVTARFAARLRQIAADATEGAQTRQVAAEDLKGLKQYQDGRVQQQGRQ